ncbi:MAG: LysR family transcriptional regulator [Acidobacteria bacterium]|nr:MAG: LysR family transcriptional regulator [Acidobacteriota bacterium]
MDLRLLEIFCCVYEERSFSRAAQRLHLTQPTISGHIKSLEEYFGISLFDRLGREVRPTRAGELLYEHGHRIVDMKRRAIEGMHRFLGRLEGDLHLSTSTIPGEYLLPSMLGRFRKRYPHIRVAMTISDTQAVIAQVERGDIEIGIVGARVNDSTLQFREFATDRLILVAPRTDRWDRIRALSLDQLRNEPLLIREPGSGTRIVLERTLARYGYQLGDFNVVAQLGSTTAIKEAIKANVGLSILSHLAVQTEMAAGLMKAIRIREIKRLERHFFIVTNRRRTKSPLSEAFLEFLASSPHP